MQTLNDLIYSNESPSQIKFDPSSSNPTYIGINQSLSAPTTDANWNIIYLESDTSIKMNRGAWDDRASLF